MAMRTSPKQPLGVVYDSGALAAADRDDRRMWAIHARALQRGVRPIVPAGCVVEAWVGKRPVNLSRLLEGCEIEVLEQHHAKRSGARRAASARSASAVDATVVESSIRRGAAVATSDRLDIEGLAIAAKRRLSIIDV